MATLHVRNVPDELYEALRGAAQKHGRSIGAQTIALLTEALVDRKTRFEPPVRIFSQVSPFRRRFAATAKDIVLRAQELARELGAAEVLPAHVLLAMLEDSILRPTLERGGVTSESVTAALPPAARPRESAPPVSAEARLMLERALLATLD